MVTQALCNAKRRQADSRDGTWVDPMTGKMAICHKKTPLSEDFVIELIKKE